MIVGPTPLRGTEIHVPDLRAGFSYVIAALVAEGPSTITNVGLIRRGYESFEDKLLALGADLDVSTRRRAQTPAFRFHRGAQ